MTAQDLVNAGFYGYAGWSDAAAEADFNATGGAGKGGFSSYGTSSLDGILQSAIDPYVSYFKASKNYETENPFFFDEELARSASTAEYAPYYDDMLTDYTTTIENTKSRSQEDLKTTLERLSASKEYYVGRERRLLDKSMRSTNEGYAGNNLFFSGARERDIKELEGEYMAGIGTEEQPGYYLKSYATNVGEAKRDSSRTLADATIQQNIYNRSWESSKKSAIEGGVLQRESETREEYEEGRKKYYEDWYLGSIGA